MGLFDIDRNTGNDGSKLDLLQFEKQFAEKFNSRDIRSYKYMAEEFGVFYTKKEGADLYRYDKDNPESIILCPEPVSFLHDYDDVSDNIEAARKRFLERISSFQTIKLNRAPVLKIGEESGQDAPVMWMNKTLTGINLRPGNFKDDRQDFTPIQMCDDNVHGLIVGRTGSGKSVFINALILSLITEYAPWELDLYLADFKKVELSRYMNDSHGNDYIDKNGVNHGGTPFTPHVNCCAATSEIRYVISVFQYLVDCMNARNEFFTRVGVTKIQEFRERFQLVLPRVLLIVDEFQQLFMESTNSEGNKIRSMLNAITKLGRATGFHLIFASQEMSGTLEANTKANFKIRMALPCNVDISSDILGNKAASQLKRGFVLVNTTGNEMDNMEYHVPFVQTEKKDVDVNPQKTDFYRYLDQIKAAGNLYREELYSKCNAQKFYREELQEEEKAYLAELDRICSRKNEHLHAKNDEIFDSIVLGKTVEYSTRRNDKVSFSIERGRNKNIIVASPIFYDQARILNLLAENLLRTDIPTGHYYLGMNPLVENDFKLEALLKNSRHSILCWKENTPESVEQLNSLMLMRSVANTSYKRHEDWLFEASALTREIFPVVEDEQRRANSIMLEQEKQQAEKELETVCDNISNLKKYALMDAQEDARKFLDYLNFCSKHIDLIYTKPFSLNPQESSDFCKLNEFSQLEAKIQESTGLWENEKEITAFTEECVKKAMGNQRNKLDKTPLKCIVMMRAVKVYFEKHRGCQESAELNKQYGSQIYPAYEEWSKTAQNAGSLEMDEALIKKIQDAKEQYAKNMARQKELEKRLKRIQESPDYISEPFQKLKAIITQFLTEVFVLANPKIKYPDYVLTETVSGSRLRWSAQTKAEDIFRFGIQDVLDSFSAYCNSGKWEQSRKIFWLIDMTEIGKNKSFFANIQTSVTHNILVIGSISDASFDSDYAKDFDYAFATGEVEAVYNKVKVPFTKQSMDSIAVNFATRSKGAAIPFKIYRSEKKIVKQASIDDILDEMNITET